MPDTSRHPSTPARPAADGASAESRPVDHGAWLIARLPTTGRVHRGAGRVRLGDARPGRRSRLDGIARLLQDVAEDDAEDADLGDDVGWMLRRTEMVVEQFPVLGERLELVTFCSGTGARWAERTTLVTGEAGARVATGAVWVAVDRRSARPTRLGDRFHELYGPSAGTRRVHLRSTLASPPRDLRGTTRRPWPLRTADLDVWGHANNAVAWAAVEEALDEHPRAPLAAVVEHAAAMLLDVEPHLVVDAKGSERHLWLLGGADGRVLVAARLQPAELGGSPHAPEPPAPAGNTASTDDPGKEAELRRRDARADRPHDG